MTDSSSAGNPGGAGLPAEHPLGPAAPIPPLEKEAGRSGQGTGNDGQAGSAPREATSGSGEGKNGHPDGDRREAVLDPSAGSAVHEAASIRDEQGTHTAGTVPAAFNGDGSPEDPDEDRHPEDAVAEPDRWDSGGAKD